MIKKILAISLLIMLFQTNFSLAKTQKNEDKNMSRTEICQKNFRTLFKGEALSKQGSDPEMMEILQKYIFGEIFTVGNLDLKTRELITITTLATMQTLPQLKAHTNGALNAGATPLEIREAMYQLAPFIGFPKTLNAIATVNEVFKEQGIELPLKSAKTVEENERFEKGYAIQNPVYGNEIKEALSNLPDNMGDDVSRFLTEFCFGDIYTRDALDIKTRELLILTVLVTNGKFDTLESHIKGNLKVGNSKETITSAIIQAMPYVGFPNAISSLKVLKKVLNEQ